VEPIRLMDISDNHDVLRQIDLDLRPGPKHIVLDMSSSTALETILSQVCSIRLLFID